MALPVVSALKRGMRKALLNLPSIKIKRKKYIKYIRDSYSYTAETPSIVCSTCIGGMISHNLGLRFMSPTVNLWCTPSDLSKLLANIDEYLAAPLEFTKSPYDYPAAKLRGMTIYFTHYLTEKDAREKWEERKKRINPDNLFIITDDNRLSEKEAETVLSFPCRGAVIFTTQENKGEGYFTFHHVREPHPLYSVRDLKGFAPFEREFNYAAWLSGKPLSECRIPENLFN